MMVMPRLGDLASGVKQQARIGRPTASTCFREEGADRLVEHERSVCPPAGQCLLSRPICLQRSLPRTEAMLRSCGAPIAITGRSTPGLGDEWGIGYMFGQPGCWHLAFARDDTASDVWLRVEA